MLIKTISKRIILFVILCVLAFFFVKGGCTQNDNSSSSKPTEVGRDFRSLSLHPNAKEILFVECAESLATQCGVFRYHLETKQLQRYNLPQGYAYLEAKLSPLGNYIVMRRIPLWKENEEKIRLAYEHAEIVVMRGDGSGFRVLSLSTGLKIGPIMSHGEDKIAYWRSQLREPNSKTFAANFDLWELDLKTGEDRLFAGSFRFYQVGQMQYMPKDREILMEAYGPNLKAREGMDISEYSKKYNRSEIYKLSRGQLILSPPLFSEKVERARSPTMDQLGNIYYEAGLPGIHLFKSHGVDSAPVKQWIENSNFNYIRSLVIAFQGNFLMFIYNGPNSDYGDYSASAIGRLDTIAGTWHDIPIPKLDTAEVCIVQLSFNGQSIAANGED